MNKFVLSLITVVSLGSSTLWGEGATTDQKLERLYFPTNQEIERFLCVPQAAGVSMIKPPFNLRDNLHGYDLSRQSEFERHRFDVSWDLPGKGERSSSCDYHLETVDGVFQIHFHGDVGYVDLPKASASALRRFSIQDWQAVRVATPLKTLLNRNGWKITVSFPGEVEGRPHSFDLTGMELTPEAIKLFPTESRNDGSVTIVKPCGKTITLPLISRIGDVTPNGLPLHKWRLFYVLFELKAINDGLDVELYDPNQLLFSNKDLED